MEYQTYNMIFTQLKQEAETLGFTLSYTTGRNEISHKFKVIYMKFYIHTLSNLYAFCHELGHARDKNLNMELYNNNRLYKIYIEIKAWILGYEFVKKYKLPKYQYIRESIPHLKTYIFYKNLKK